MRVSRPLILCRLFRFAARIRRIFAHRAREPGAGTRMLTPADELYVRAAESEGEIGECIECLDDEQIDQPPASMVDKSEC